MYQKDYLLKIIEEIAFFLSQIVKDRKGKNPTKALEKVEKCYAAMLKVSPKEIKSLPVPEIWQLLVRNGRNDLRFMESLSKLLYEEAMLAQDKEKEKQLFQKAYDVLRYVEEKDISNFSFDRQLTLENLLIKLKNT